MKRLAFIGLMLLGCGGGGGAPSQHQTCRDACSFQLMRCGSVATSADVNACKLQCDAMKSGYDASDAQYRTNCKNADEILSTVYECNTEDCGQLASQDCANTALNSCVPK